MTRVGAGSRASRARLLARAGVGVAVACALVAAPAAAHAGPEAATAEEGEPAADSSSAALAPAEAAGASGAPETDADGGSAGSGDAWSEPAQAAGEGAAAPTQGGDEPDAVRSGADGEADAQAAGEGTAALSNVDPQAADVAGDAPLPAACDAPAPGVSLADVLTPQELAGLGVSTLSVEDGTTSFAELAAFAAQYLGWPYQWAGSSEADGGFDCSGFVSWVFLNTTGVNLRAAGGTAQGIFDRGCTPVPSDEAQPGDLVFFYGTYQPGGMTHDEALRYVSHVGIYLGDGLMLHAGSQDVGYARVEQIRNVDGKAAQHVFARVTGATVTRASYYRFYDVPTDAWYVQGGYLDYVADEGLMTGGALADGSSNGLFMPEDTLSRGQVATIIYRYANPDSTDTTIPGNYAASSAFSDVRGGEYYTAAINWCRDNGVITGFEDAGGKPLGLFGPDEPVTREQLATMVARFAAWCGTDVTAGAVGSLGSMPDAADVDAFAADALRWCMGRGIITGYVDGEGTSWLLPLQGATRSQMAKVVTVLVRDVLGG